MEAPSPHVRGEILARYQKLRAIGRRLNSRLVDTLDREAIQEGGRRLGILKKDVLYFDTEDVSIVLTDYTIHHVRRDGLNAVEHYLAASPPPPESDESKILRAMCELRYSLFEVQEVDRGFGLQAWDMLRDETGLLVDVSFSQTARPGLVLATNVYSPDDFWMTTGAALPVLPDFQKGLLQAIRRRFGKAPQQFRGMAPEQQSQLATLVIRTCLREGAAERIAYQEPRLHGPHRTAPAPASTRVRVRRNDPCPCGSGRKYRNCCRRH